MDFPYIASHASSYEGPQLYPLEVGKIFSGTKTETTTVTALGETETETETNTYTLEVEKIEDIAVAAGIFKCFKVVKYDEHGRVDTTSWYSDNTKAYVKRIVSESGDIIELQSYSVK